MGRGASGKRRPTAAGWVVADHDRPRSRAWEALGILADVATFGLAVWFVMSLASYASGARFQSDECFHAVMAEWIASHGTLPRVVPELYSGFYYYYPPLFHILGGIGDALFGVGAFKYLNVFITALLLVGIYAGCWALGSRAAGRWAIALCVMNAWLVLHAMRLYVEQLTALLAAFAFLLMVRVARTATLRSAIGLGVVTGLALIAKNSSLVLIGVLAALAAFHAARRRPDTARAFAIALGVALLVSAPMFIRNQVLYGSAVYPAFAPDLHPLLYQLNKSKFTPSPRAFYQTTAEYTGWAIGFMLLAALALAAIRRRGSIELALLGVCLLLYAMAPLQPLLDPRHMLPVMVVAAVLGSLLVARHLPWRVARAAIGVALLALAVRSTAQMPNYRQVLNSPPDAASVYQEVHDRVPAGETVLSLSTYDTYYYARRPATWPIPWGQKEHPVEMFLTSDCDSVMLALGKYHLKYMLLSRISQADAFDGANHPVAFLTCVSKLLDQGRLELLWASESMGLVRVAEGRGGSSP